ncbi:uncharacterized protein LOC109853038 isoform X2 [Pseudomyrmex gracilis]|uniref:uncharacterized protein LOC109853038 isoform X2 n=1 Tax=Pseudomyrmex gracilis TaxID=219809 RepID=UPI000995A03F|nr:uncharacterized protein LOC109853038 isoform X2 [Pseudomyrmex gracilis]
MICVENENFRLNRILLLAVGLWPYERSLLVRIQFISIFSILIASVVFQITAIWTSEYKIDRIIKILSCALPFALPVIKYIAFMINSCTVKYLLEHLQHICNELKDENEIAIMRQYGNDATLFTTRLLRFPQL